MGVFWPRGSQTKTPRGKPSNGRVASTRPSGDRRGNSINNHLTIGLSQFVWKKAGNARVEKVQV